MATSAVTWTREALAAAPQTYFDAVDAMDVDKVLAHFADDATLTVQTDHVTFDGADEIRRMFTDFFDFDADGKFKRVIIWMAGTNPLK